MKQTAVIEKTRALRILYAVIFVIAVVTLRDYHFYGLTFRGWLVHDVSPFALGGVLGLQILHWVKPRDPKRHEAQAGL